MANKELVDYFNRLNGKTVSPSQIKIGNKQLNAEVISAIKKNGVDSEGACKECVFFGDKKVFAMLKSKLPVKKPEAFNELTDANGLVNLNQQLINEGAKIAKTFCKFYSNQRIIEIQERFYGSEISIANLQTFSKKVLGFEFYPNTSISSENEKKLGKEIYKYNLSKQKLMLTLPQKCYDELFNTFLILNRHGLKFFDNHSGNILVGEDGFTLIDLDYEQWLSGGMKKPYDFNSVVKDFLFPFSSADLFCDYLTNGQIKEFNKNNVEIYKKLIDAVSSFGIKIDVETIKPVLTYAVGTDLLNEKFNYIFDSQNRIKNK